VALKDPNNRGREEKGKVKGMNPKSGEGPFKGGTGHFKGAEEKTIKYAWDSQVRKKFEKQQGNRREGSY